MSFYSIRPVDIVFFRGNKLFGGAGDHSESMMPPWPSVFSGALRSLMISGDDKLWSMAHRKDEGIAQQLNNLLRVTFIALKKDGKVFFQPPRDMIFFDNKDGNIQKIEFLSIQDKRDGNSYNKLPKVLTLAGKDKPANHYWISAAGLKKYLKGENPSKDDIQDAGGLWKSDYRLGIALDSEKWSAKEHAIYTSDAVVLDRNAEFMVGTDRDAATGMIRLGGDGRAAKVDTVEFEPPWMGTDVLDKIVKTGRFKVILATPGIFPNGWLMPGVDDKYELHFQGLTARLVAAKVDRYTIISGWDMLRRQPKPAQRAVPAGCVYYFETTAGKDALRELAKSLLQGGLWALMNKMKPLDQARRAEGFNNVFIGVWNEAK